MSDYKDIYLQPECCADPYDGQMWSQDSAPGDECEEGVEWTHYIRADRFEALQEENAGLKRALDVISADNELLRCQLNAQT